jgi:hypothetical protein
MLLEAPASWYRDPTIAGLVGALGGALIGALATLWVWRKSNKIKRVDCVFDDPIALLTQSDAFRGRLDLQFNGRPVTAAYVFTFEIVNTGNQAVANQPVLLRFAEDREVVDVKVETEPSLGFGDVTITGKGARDVHVAIALLNPGDSIRLEVLTLGNQHESVKVGLKNADVIARVLPRASLRTALAEVAADSAGVAALSAIPLLGKMATTYATLELGKKIDRSQRRRR